MPKNPHPGLGCGPFLCHRAANDTSAQAAEFDRPHINFFGTVWHVWLRRDGAHTKVGPYTNGSVAAR